MGLIQSRQITPGNSKVQDGAFSTIVGTSGASTQADIENSIQNQNKALYGLKLEQARLKNSPTELAAFNDNVSQGILCAIAGSGSDRKNTALNGPILGKVANRVDENGNLTAIGLEAARMIQFTGATLAMLPENRVDDMIRRLPQGYPAGNWLALNNQADINAIRNSYLIEKDAIKVASLLANKSKDDVQAILASPTSLYDELISGDQWKAEYKDLNIATKAQLQGENFNAYLNQLRISAGRNLDDNEKITRALTPPAPPTTVPPRP